MTWGRSIIYLFPFSVRESKLIHSIIIFLLTGPLRAEKDCLACYSKINTWQNHNRWLQPRKNNNNTNNNNHDNYGELLHFHTLLCVLIPGTLSFESVPSIKAEKEFLWSLRCREENIKTLISLVRVAVNKSQCLFCSDSWLVINLWHQAD